MCLDNQQLLQYMLWRSFDCVHSVHIESHAWPHTMYTRDVPYLQITSRFIDNAIIMHRCTEIKKYNLVQKCETVRV